MSTRASHSRAVRSSLAVLLRIAVLFGLTVLFLLPYSRGSVGSHGEPARSGKMTTDRSICSTYSAKAAISPTEAPLF